MSNFGTQPTDEERLLMATERLRDCHERNGDLLESNDRLTAENAALRLDLMADDSTIERLRAQVADLTKRTGSDA